MLVLTYNRRVSTDTNNIVLFKDEVYYHVDRGTYDASLLLQNKFNLETMIDQISYEGCPVERGIVEWLYDLLPTPINILAPFLLTLNETPEWEVEECIQILHVITNTISPYRFLSVPKEVRRSVEFSLSVKDESELSTSRFINQSFDFNELTSLLLNAGETTPYQTSQSTESSYTKASKPYQEEQYVEEKDWSAEPESVEEADVHPDWIKTGPGVYMHSNGQDLLFFDTEEDDEEFFANQEEESIFGVSVTSDGDKEETPEEDITTTTSSEEKTALNKLIL